VAAEVEPGVLAGLMPKLEARCLQGEGDARSSCRALIALRRRASKDGAAEAPAVERRLAELECEAAAGFYCDLAPDLAGKKERAMELKRAAQRCDVGIWTSCMTLQRVCGAEKRGVCAKVPR
jgi:hypothetical protein